MQNNNAFILRNYQQAATDNSIAWVKYQPEKNGLVVIATGGGKSILIAKLAEAFPEKRILVLAHRKELLEQNASKVNMGGFSVYSAGLGERDLNGRVVFAGIQSIANIPENDLPAFDLVLVDECHNVSNNSEDETRYWSLFRKLGNPQIIGYTATPFRLTGGKLSWGETIYEVGYKQLLNDKWVAPITNKVSNTPDLSAVTVRLGEYVESQLEDAMLDPELLAAAIEAILAYSAGRNSILIFAISKKHCELLNHALIETGIAGGCAFVTGDTPSGERAQIVEDFRNQNLRVLINCMVFVEGFDVPCVDMVVHLRPTKSKTLWEQSVGRGVRLSPDTGKTDCLLLDMAGNLQEHGGLGYPYTEKAKKELAAKEKGRICPECETFNQGNNITACEDCGYQFPEPETKVISHNYTVDFSTDTVGAEYATYDVRDVAYRRHKKEGKPDSIKVDYICPMAKYGSVAEWISPHSDSDFAVQMAYVWLKKRGIEYVGQDLRTIPLDIIMNDCEQKAQKPIEIGVDLSEKYARIKEYKYAKIEEENRGSYPDSFGELDLDDAIPY